MSYIYLASPYSHADKAIMEQRYFKAEAATAWLLNQGIWVYSPIVHCHNLAVKYKLPTDFTYWELYNNAMINAARAFHVLVIDGTFKSNGVSEELTYARSIGRPVAFIFQCGEGYITVDSIEELMRNELLNDPQNS